MQDRASAARIVGRYLVFEEIASGGMASVHLGRLLGPAGFSRTVAIKRLHPQFAKDPEFCAMFMDEARLAARVCHPNVVQTLDIVMDGGEFFLVMEYVAGESLARLVRSAAGALAPALVSGVMVGVLSGLHAAHEACDDEGRLLGIVHRDVSPQNVLVGVDGLARVLDFGVAKARGRSQATAEGQVKGKLAYMSPEQLRGRAIDRRTDVWAAGVVAWELIAGRSLFGGGDQGSVIGRVLEQKIEPPGFLPLDSIVLRALERDPEARFATAEQMARAFERAVLPASPAEIGAWVNARAERVIAHRAERVTAFERSFHTLAAVAEPAGGWTQPAAPVRRRRVVIAGVIAAAVLGACALLVIGFVRAKPSAPTAVAASALAPSVSVIEPLASAAATAERAPSPVVGAEPAKKLPAHRVVKPRTRTGDLHGLDDRK